MTIGTTTGVSIGVIPIAAGMVLGVNEWDLSY